MDAVLLFEDVMQVVGLLSISAAWVGALWGSYAFWQSRDNPTWKKAAYGAWIVHNLGILGALGLLFYILLTHRFEFYYAWAHGSKLLPTAYTLAAVWEGQEGSFLLWVFWQVVLGWGIIAWRRPWEEKAFVLAGLSAWNAFLTTFLLGVTLPRWVMGLVAGGAAFFLVGGGMALLWRVLGGGALLLAVIFLPVGWLVGLGVGLIGMGLWRRWPLKAVLTAVGLLWLPLFGEQIGSFPFLYLWQVKPEVPAGFIPADGNGLNPLLQSVWMVIHPPVLFLGYSLALLPYLQALYGLAHLERLGALSRSLLHFTWLAAAGLGAGIALGALWAYETLNFGGYWNWDPVENASLAPWLVLIAGGHFVWLYRRTRSHQTLALFFSALAWPLVLYSAYLTRSGVLAESSVHSFTDLGLGGGLSYGVLLALVVPVSWGLYRMRGFTFSLASLSRTALGLGALTFLAMAGIVLGLTSLPVLNLLFGTRLALGREVLRVYYEAVAPLTAMGLFLMGYAFMSAWRRKGWHWVSFLSAFLLAGVVGLLWYEGWDFVYHGVYREALERFSVESLRAVLFLVVDDLVLGGALAAIGGALAVLWPFRRASWPGALAHVGFGLMIVGALFSSGYQKVLSVPIGIGGAGEGDNLLIPKGAKVAALGYWVRYEGLLQPMPPLSEFRPVLSQAGQTLWRFRDSLGYAYQIWLPDQLFAESPKPVIRVSTRPQVRFIEENIAILPVEPADNTYRYEVVLLPYEDSLRAYRLLLLADLSEKTGLLAHPAHVRFWHGDLYVHLTSLPKVEGPPIAVQQLGLAVGDTAHWEEEGLSFYFEKLTEVEGAPLPTYHAWIRLWRGASKVYQRFPVRFLLQERELVTPPTSVPAYGLSMEIARIDPKARQVYFLVKKRRSPDAFVALKILYKPLISFLWGGIALMLVGLVGAAWRHWQ
jgi:cytochrome c-type biogenesis protein CcmF